MNVNFFLIFSRLFSTIQGFKATMAYEECLEKHGIVNGTKSSIHNSTVAHNCDFKKFMTEVRILRDNYFFEVLTKKRNRRYPAKTITDADYADDIVILANTPN